MSSMTLPILSTAASGLVGAMDRVDAVAMRLAQAGTAEGSDTDLAAEAVELSQAKVAAKANVAVMRAADEMTGALLDILA